MLQTLLAAAAVVCLAVTLLLGYSVTRSASLWRIDAEAAALRGAGAPAALMFTLSGRAMPLFFIAAAAFGITLALRAGWKLALAIFLVQLISQAGAELLKRWYRRPRPDYWLVHEELGFSYPSGHATTAVFFYGSWAVLGLLLPIPKTISEPLAAALGAWAGGIVWSRLALGAHYPVDVTGGAFFGAMWACIFWLLVLSLHAMPLR